MNGYGWGTILYFLGFAAFFLLMMRFGCGSHIMGHGSHGHGSHDSHGGSQGATPERATDPVCGMSVETRSARTSLYEGRPYYFCSTSCRDKFESDPRRYGSRPGAA